VRQALDKGFRPKVGHLAVAGELVPRVLNATSHPGVVLDPFIGSGTVASCNAARDNGWGSAEPIFASLTSSASLAEQRPRHPRRSARLVGARAVK